MRIMQSRLEVFSANMDTFQVSRLWWSYVIPCQENFLHTTTRRQIASIRPIALKKDGRPFLLKKNYTSFDEFVNEELLLELSTKSLYAHSLYSTHQGSGLMYWSMSRYSYYLTTSSRMIPRPSSGGFEDFLGLPPNSGKLKLTSKNNVKTYRGKEMIQSCPSQNKLADIFQPSNKDLYALLVQNPGPPM